MNVTLDPKTELLFCLFNSRAKLFLGIFTFPLERGLLPIMDYTGRLQHKLVHLSGLRLLNNYSMSTCWIQDGRLNYLISNKREWNNCFIKDTQRNPSKLATMIEKTMRTPNVFVVHGGHIPLPVNQSEYTIASFFNKEKVSTSLDKEYKTM